MSIVENISGMSVSWITSEDFACTKSKNLALVISTKCDSQILRDFVVGIDLALIHKYMTSVEKKGPVEVKDPTGIHGGFGAPDKDPVDEIAMHSLNRRILRSTLYPIDGVADGNIVVHSLRDVSCGLEVKAHLGLHALVCIYGLPDQQFVEEIKHCVLLGKSIMRAINQHNKMRSLHNSGPKIPDGIMCLSILLHTLHCDKRVQHEIGNSLLKGMIKSFMRKLSPSVQLLEGSPPLFSIPV